MSQVYRRRRTIEMTDERSKQVEYAAHEAGMSGERFIQAAISLALMLSAQDNRPLAVAFALFGGFDAAELERLARETPDTVALAAIGISRTE